MARGTSGRIVIEIDPRLKQRLHAALALDGLSLKEWFLRQVYSYLGSDQATIAGADRAPAIPTRAEQPSMIPAPVKQKRNRNGEV